MKQILAKKVSMLELFYDLIYVFAIAKTTGLIHHLHHGVVPLDDYLKFLVVCIVIILLWLNETIYTNKYGSNKYYDIIGMFLHMFGAIYISNSILLDWDRTFHIFNKTAVFMSLVLLIQHWLKSREYPKVPVSIKSSIILYILEIIGLTIGLLLGIKNGGGYVVVAVYISMIVVPSIIFSMEEQKELNFPHLVERFSLIIIISFGEMIVGIANIFGKYPLTLVIVMKYITVVLLFGIYVLQIEKLMNHHQSVRGFGIVYSSIAIFVGLTTLTVSFSFGIEPDVNWLFLKLFKFWGLFLFFAGLLISDKYNKDKYKIQKMDILKCFGLFLIGFLITLSAKPSNYFVLNFGAFSTVALIFIYKINFIKTRKKLLKF